MVDCTDGVPARCPIRYKYEQLYVLTPEKTQPPKKLGFFLRRNLPPLLATNPFSQRTSCLLHSKTLYDRRVDRVIDHVPVTCIEKVLQSSSDTINVHRTWCVESCVIHFVSKAFIFRLHMIKLPLFLHTSYFKSNVYFSIQTRKAFKSIKCFLTVRCDFPCNSGASETPLPICAGTMSATLLNLNL